MTFIQCIIGVCGGLQWIRYCILLLAAIWDKASVYLFCHIYMCLYYCTLCLHNWVGVCLWACRFWHFRGYIGSTKPSMTDGWYFPWVYTYNYTHCTLSVFTATFRQGWVVCLRQIGIGLNDLGPRLSSGHLASRQKCVVECFVVPVG